MPFYKCNEMLGAIPSATYCCAKCRYAECHYADCCYAECHYAAYHYAACHHIYRSIHIEKEHKCTARALHTQIILLGFNIS